MKINNQLFYPFNGIIGTALALLCIFLFTGCQLGTGMGEGQEQLQDQNGTGGQVAMELHDTMPYGEAPPIDLNLPENLETATFGMG